MLKVIGISILFIPIIIALGCIESQPSEPAEMGESPFVTKNASEIGLKINDLPTESKKEPSGIDWPYEWKINRVSVNETYFASSFEQEPYTTTDLLESYVWSYSTVDEAKQNFHRLRNNSLRVYKLVSVRIGDENFAWETESTSEVVFRKANIVVRISYYKYEGDGSINNAKKYAKIVEKKI